MYVFNEAKKSWSGVSFSVRSAVLVAALAVVCFLSAPTLRAQIVYGSVIGSVEDPSGASIPGAAVTVTATASNVSKNAITNGDGNFSVENLDPGTYSVQIVANGFQRYQTSVTVAANNTRRVDAQLPLGSLTESVSVEAANQILTTDRSDFNSTVSAQQVEQLPTGPSRNFQNLYELIPGFSGAISTHSSAGNPAGSIQYNVNGISFGVNSTILNGASDVYQWIPDLALYIPPAESIQSFNVVTSNYAADQGMAGGAVTTIITKTGGNAFHGSAWEYHQDNALNAKPYFYAAPRLAKSILNQFGAAVGGPIKRDRVFFFADWERTSSRTGVSAYYTLPNASVASGNFNGTGTTIYDPATGNAAGQGRTGFAGNQIPMSRLSPIAQKIISYLPTVAVPMGGNLANDYFYSATIPSTQDNIDGKLTYNVSEATNVFAQYSTSRKNVIDPQPFGTIGGNTADGGIPGTASGVTQLATLGATHTFSPRLVANGTLGYTRQVISAFGSDIGTNFGSSVLGIPGTNGPNMLQGGVPAFNIGGFSAYGNTNANGPFSFKDNQYALAAAVHYTRGNHSLSAGTDILQFRLNHFQASGSFPARGGFSFTGGNTALNGGAAPNLYNAYADFLLGLANSDGTTYQYFTRNTLNENEFAFYIEDQWQVNPKLTLTFGIRDEIYPYEHASHFGGVVFDPATNRTLIGGYGQTPFNPGVNTGSGSFMPRFGAAYRILDHTVLRGGYSLGVNPSNFKYSLNTYPFVLQTNYNAANSYSASGTLATGIPAIPALPDITAGSVSIPSNYAILSYAKNFDRGEIHSYNLVLEQQFRSWLASQLSYVGNVATNMSCVLNVNAGTPGSGTAGLPYNQPGVANPTTNARNLYSPICGSSYNGLFAQLKVNGAGFNGSGISYAWSKTMSSAYYEDYYLPYNTPDVFFRNRALSPYDLTNNLKAFAVYNSPFGKGKKLLTSGIGSALLGGWQVNSILTYRSGTPFTVSSSGASLNAPGEIQTANQLKKDVAIYGAHSPGHHYFDPTAFGPVTTVSYGTSGLYSLRGPGLFNLDAGLRRSFPLVEGTSAEFLAQAFHLTNTPQFGNPGATVSNASFSNGQITSYNGYDTITSAGGSRILQFGLIIRF